MELQRELASMIAQTYEFYEKEFSEFAITVWLGALKGFEMEQIKRAFAYHIARADNGQFMPKPADIVRILRGSTSDRASVAWGKVDKAVRSIGNYQSIVFDDPIIHLVIEDMGGWVQICSKSDRDWPFTENHFKTSYKGYASRSERPQPMKRLIGLTEADCERHGRRVPDPILIGDQRKALALFNSGNDQPRLEFNPLSDVAEKLLLAESVARKVG